RHQAGILTGGSAVPGLSSPIPATGQIVFYAQINDQFDFPHPPGDPFVDKDDPLTNCVQWLTGQSFTNEVPPTIPSITGVVAEDDSETAIAIVTDIIEKTVYAVKRGGTEICGPNTPNALLCLTPQVKPDDKVTFRIKYTIPSGDAEKLTITDWLPLPIFDVGDPDASGTAGPSWPAAVTAICSPSPALPAPGSACHLVPPPTTPTLTASPPTATNSLTFDYGTFNNPFNTPLKIDLLFTLTVTNDPFADGLFLTNEALECEDNTFGVT